MKENRTTKDSSIYISPCETGNKTEFSEGNILVPYIIYHTSIMFQVYEDQNQVLFYNISRMPSEMPKIVRIADGNHG